MEGKRRKKAHGRAWILFHSVCCSLVFSCWRESCRHEAMGIVILGILVIWLMDTRRLSLASLQHTR